MFAAGGAIVSGARARCRRDRLAGDARQRLAHEPDPRRVGGRILEQGAPFGRCGLAVAVLLVRQAEKIARLRLMRIERDGALEGRLGLVRHDAVGGGDQRLAEIGLACGGLAVERQRFAPRRNRVIEAAEPHIDRSDHLPAGVRHRDCARGAPRPD